jgi:hypothetical protein
VTSPGDSPPTQSDEDIVELVRVINRARHISPTARTWEKEFIVRNNSEESKSYIFIPLVEFRLNLEVFDEDDTRLNYFPNSEVDELLDELRDESEEGYKKIEKRFDGIEYKLLVQLPQDNPIRPGELRTIRISFGQSEAVEYHRLSDRPWFNNYRLLWKRKLFTVPSYVARAERSPHEKHSEHFVVEGPEGYATVADSSTEYANRDGFYELGYGRDTQVLSTRLPPPNGNGYTWKLKYELISVRRGLMKLLAVFWLVSSITSFIILFQFLDIAGCISLSGKLFETSYRTIGQTFSAGLVTGLVGVIFRVRNQWASRYRILCLIPLLLHISSWALWYLVP